MSLGVKLSAFAAAVVLSGSVFAQDPLCPDLSEIQSVGIMMAYELGYDFKIGISINHFNTPDTWGFVIGPVETDSDEETIEMTNEILAGMTAPGVPDPTSEELTCIYDTGTPDVFAVAIKYKFGMSPMKLKQYITKAR